MKSWIASSADSDGSESRHGTVPVTVMSQQSESWIAVPSLRLGRSIMSPSPRYRATAGTVTVTVLDGSQSSESPAPVTCNRDTHWWEIRVKVYDSS